MENITISQQNTANAAPPNAEEILSYLVQSGKINLNGVAKDMKKTRREKLLEVHPFAISEGRDGRWRTYINDETKPNGRRQIAKATEEKLLNFLSDYYRELMEPEDHTITMAMLFEDWMAFKALHVASTTVDRDRRTWKRYYEGTPLVNKPIQLLTKLELDEWVHSTIKQNRMNKHQYGGMRVILNQELDYAVDRGIILKNPFKDVKVNMRRVLQPERKKPDHTQVFTKKELDGLCELAWEDFHSGKHPVHQLTALAVMFMFYTGLRIGEVCSIRYEDIDGRVLNVRRLLRYPGDEIVEHTKGSFGDRTVPLVSQAIELIDAARQRQQEAGVSDDGYIFSMRDTPILYTSVAKAFYQYCRKLGIIRKSSHKARKTFVSTLVDADVNINTVRQIVGHVDERTTLNNYCYDRSSDEEKFAQLENAFA